MAIGMTHTMARVLTFIEKFWGEHGQSPPMDEIALGCDLLAKSRACVLVDALVERGHVRRLHLTRRRKVVPVRQVSCAPDNAPLYFVHPAALERQWASLHEGVRQP